MAALDPTKIPYGQLKGLLNALRSLYSVGDNGIVFSDALDIQNGIWTGLENIRIKTAEIGGWDMDADATKAVAHELTFANIVDVGGYIINDAGTEKYFFGAATGGTSDVYFPSNVAAADATNITLARKNAGKFDLTTFNDDTISRGKLFIVYTA